VINSQAPRIEVAQPGAGSKGRGPPDPLPPVPPVPCQEGPPGATACLRKPIQVWEVS
jgi:hypothetical protein